jgi:hypothetical protein
VREHVLQRSQRVPVPAERAFDFYAATVNLEPMTPPWLHFRVTTPRPIAMDAGTLLDFRRDALAAHFATNSTPREISSYVEESDIPMGSPGGYWTGEGLGGDVVSRRSDALRGECRKRNRATTRER